LFGAYRFEVDALEESEFVFGRESKPSEEVWIVVSEHSPRGSRSVRANNYDNDVVDKGEIE